MDENISRSKSFGIIRRYSMRDSFISIPELVDYISNRGVDDTLNFKYPIQNISQRFKIPNIIMTSKNFKNIEFLKHGSFSSVYSVLMNGVKVAVKILKDSSKRYQTAEKRIILEAEILSRLSHPNIISILGFGENNTRKFIVLEHLEGGTLLDTLNPYIDILDCSSLSSNDSISSKHSKVFTLPLQRVISIALSLAAALQFLHEEAHPEATLIHRDLKPDNIGFTVDGTLKLFDFGLVACVKKRTLCTEAYKMTGNVGTLAYMAPEVALSQPYSEKVDIYSFGMILWQMTSGVAPFAEMSKFELMMKVVKNGNRPHIRSGLPLPLTRLIERCWDSNPSVRPDFACIQELLLRAQEMVARREAAVGPSNNNNNTNNNNSPSAPLASRLLNLLRVTTISKVSVADIYSFNPKYNTNTNKIVPMP